jgi:TRAP-type uncharacterized transport system fused permease subunit
MTYGNKGDRALGGVIQDGKEIKLDQEHLDDLEVKYSNIRNLARWVLIIVSLIAIFSSLYHLYASIYMPNYQLHLSLHLMFMMTLAFFMYPVWSKTLKGGKVLDKMPIYDWALALLSIGVCMYWILNYNDIIMRSGIESQTDLIVGGIGILLVLEATRRMVGPALSILAGIFIIYAYFGSSMPGILQNRGYSIERIIGQLCFADNGIFGMQLEAVQIGLIASPFLYPAVRILQAVIVMLIAVPLLRVLRKTNWLWSEDNLFSQKTPAPLIEPAAKP